MNEAEEIARIASICGLQDPRCMPLGFGVASTAWLATDGLSSLAIRFIPTSSSRLSTYISEHNILRTLYENKRAVPEPVMTSTEVQDVVVGWKAWSAVRQAKGEPIDKTPFTEELSSQLGDFVREVHALTATGYGPLRQVSDVLSGGNTNLREGIRSRWLSAPIWPFDESDPTENNATILRPDLLARLLRQQSAVLEVGTTGPAVLNHGDIHQQHIFHVDHNLTAVIDFGGSFIGVPAWDFAVISVFLGWTVAEASIAQYSDSVSARQRLLESSKLLALAFSLYRLKVEVGHSSPSSIVNEIIEHLEITLKRLGA